MSYFYGEALHLTLFGQSHAPAVGMTLEGMPAGISIDTAALSRFLARRAPGKADCTSARQEADRPEFLSGFVTGTTRTCGAPLTALVRNADTRPGDYAAYATVPRPGQSDYTARIKFDGAQDVAGGGPFSGRMTAALCLAGGICLQLLNRYGIRIFGRIASLGSLADEGELTDPLPDDAFPTVSRSVGEQMLAAIAAVQKEGDSLGGVAECRADGLPAGLGDALFGGMESRIATLVFAIPAIKGVEFGAGFALTRCHGSESNDAFAVSDGKIITKTNRAGGILGGITTGMPLTFRAAVKPTPTIALPQESVNLATLQPETVRGTGRHDPCILPRVIPVLEAAAALAVTDALLLSERGKALP